MTPFPRMARLAPLIGLLLMASAGAAAQTADRPSSALGAVVTPRPPMPADAVQCVEPVDVMRREHMNFLLHQRDATVIDGERDGKYSLVDCMNCHNPGDSQKPVRYPDPEHFCAECHAFTAISIDCFECHADRGLQRLRQGLPGIRGDPTAGGPTVRGPTVRGPTWSDQRDLRTVGFKPASSRVD